MDNSLEHLAPEEQEALRSTFQSQAAELLDVLNEGLLQMEAGRAEPRLLQGLQRAVHTLKGDAGSFGLTDVVRVAHRMEDLLQAVADGRVPLDRDRLAVLFQATDACEHLLRNDVEGPGPDLDPLLRALAPPRGEAAAAGAEGDDPSEGRGPDGRRSAESGARPPTRGEIPAAGPAPGLALTEYERLAAADAQARDLSLYLLRVQLDPRCRMPGAGAFLLQRHLQGACEILRAEPPLEGPVSPDSPAFALLVASALDVEALERRCLLPGIVAVASAVPADGAAQGACRGGLTDIGGRSAGADGMAQFPTASRSFTAPMAEPGPTDPTGGAALLGTSTILVDTRRIDRVMNMVGELVIARSMFHQAFAGLQARFPKADFLTGFREAHHLMERSLSDLQKGVMKIRMVPVDRIFRRLPRLVRDLAEASGEAKEVRLVLEGRATELDKGIVDALGEPLVHLIRNAVDHGIEPAAQREAQGKPRVGTLRVAARADGNQIVIQVEDDGAGIDPKRIRRTAVERGLLRPEEADALNDPQALELIFLPRFSTASQVTESSGRGIGMDAVRASVEDLKGLVQVASRPGHGSTFTLRVPLTLAIMRAILFRVAGRLFALPLSTIAEITRVDPAAVRTVDGHEVLLLRDQLISLLRLQDALALPPEDGGRGAGAGDRAAPQPDGSGNGNGREPALGVAPPPVAPDPSPPAGGGNRLYVLVVALGEQRIGLVVDRLQGEGELVIKALEADWVNQAPIAGGAILGEGRVVLILDPAALIDRAMRRGRAAGRRPRAGAGPGRGACP